MSEIQVLKTKIDHLEKELFELKQLCKDFIDFSPKDNNGDFLKEENINKNFSIVQLERETFCDRGYSWFEDKFIPASFISFDTSEEAIKYVKENLDEFPTKVYVKNNTTGKITKIKKYK